MSPPTLPPVFALPAFGKGQITLGDASGVLAPVRDLMIAIRGLESVCADMGIMALTAVTALIKNWDVENLVPQRSPFHLDNLLSLNILPIHMLEILKLLLTPMFYW